MQPLAGTCLRPAIATSSPPTCEAARPTPSPETRDRRTIWSTWPTVSRSAARSEPNPQALDVEDLLNDRIDGRGWILDIDEVETDGVSIEARMSGDEEDFTPQWLGISSISPPPSLPTATPEPESRSSTQATEAPAPMATMSPSVSATLTLAPAAPPQRPPPPDVRDT